MAKVFQSAKARNDLKGIFNYIADKSSERQASRFLNTLKATMGTLAGSPRMGTSREYLASGLLGFPKGDYIIFYKEIKEGIQVIRVIHASRDIGKLF